MHGGLFQLLETLALQHCPDLLLRKILPFRHHGLVLTIQVYAGVWDLGAMVVLERGKKGNFLGSLDPTNHLIWIQARLFHLRASKVNIGSEGTLDRVAIAFGD